MFAACINLVNAPELPATNLANRCYEDMFAGCTSLVEAPELPATTLANYCYSSMFNSCTSLNRIKINYSGAFTNTFFGSWVSKVSSTGTFYYNGTYTTRGASAIPEGWYIQSF